MACGVPCVVTDVGDSALIVGPTGRVVEAQDVTALATAWEAVLTASPETRMRLSQESRLRIERLFSLPAIVRRYENLYKEALAKSNS